MRENMLNAPIIVFGYNRPKHLKKCLEKLEISAQGKNKELFIVVDGKKSEKDLVAVNEVQQVAMSFVSNCFSTINLVFGENNRGLAKSIIDTTTEVIEKYGAVIVVEDDLFVSENFVSFMDSCLEHYCDDERVWSIGGWIPQALEGEAKNDCFLSKRAECWGWATWRNRWSMVDWDLTDYDAFHRDWKARRDFDAAGTDMSFMLEEYVAGKNHSWAIRWAFSQWKNRMYVVCPKYSLVVNGGLDGSGTNCHTYGIEQKEFSGKLSIPENLEVDNTMIKKYWNAIGYHGMRRVKMNIKRIFRR